MPPCTQTRLEQAGEVVRDAIQSAADTTVVRATAARGALCRAERRRRRQAVAIAVKDSVRIKEYKEKSLPEKEFELSPCACAPPPPPCCTAPPPLSRS